MKLFKINFQRIQRNDNNFFLLAIIIAAVIIGFHFLLVPSSSAEQKIPTVRPSVTPLDLLNPPSTEDLMAAGQLGGLLYPTNDEDIRNKDLVNLSFGMAIEEWNRHNYREAIRLFKKHIEDFPSSPWLSEARLHMGCDAKYHGRYTEAEAHFKWVIENNEGKSHEGALRLRTKAMQRLGILGVLQNNLDAATEIFANLKKESLDWRERTYASHWIQRISRYKSNKEAMLKCGTEALAYLLEEEGKPIGAREVAKIAPDTDYGHSISDLADIASRYGHRMIGLQLSILDLTQIALPAIMQISGKGSGDKGHYWVLDKVSGNNLELYDPQSKRRFTQTLNQFSKEWTGKTLLSASGNVEEIPYAKLTASEMQSSFGGCCGVPRPEDDLGEPDEKRDPCAKGSPIWKVNRFNLNLFIKDIPLWYNPPIGPTVQIQLSYNSQSAIAQNEPFGNKWQFNYASYLVVDTGETVTVFMPDGRRDVYAPDGQGGYTKPFGVFNTLTKIATNHFELSFLDGTVFVYNIPAGTNSQQPFLVEIRDAYGQKLTFGYNNDVQVETITDALGKVTTLTYYASGLVQNVVDPFGRIATFEYDANRNLTRVVDMGGYWTQFTYDTDIYLSSIQNAKGTWGFYLEPADGIYNYDTRYPAPGGVMWENYRITITNPLGGKEEYHYYGFLGNFTWYITPRDYVPYSNSYNNNSTNAPKTYFEIKRLQKPRLARVDYPEGGYRIYYSHDSSTGKPTEIYDAHEHRTFYTYNSNGLLTSFKDAKGSIKTFSYYPNAIDVQQVKFNLASTPGDDNVILKTYTYNAETHEVASVTDALNHVTAFSYNSYGQLQTIAEAQGTPIERITEFIHDPTTHNLNEIRKGGNTVLSFTYDTIGRVRTAIDSTGVTLTYDYNNLDQVTRITYPDNRFEAFTYSTCCPRILDSKTDRAELTTTYTHDALNRLIKVEGPRGAIDYEYDDNGNLTKLIDPDHKLTEFAYNLDNRLVKKIFADGKFITYSYDFDGLLTKVTNSRNLEKNYAYDPNHNLTNINYSDITPDVTFTYDDYDRVKTRIDGMGLYQYGYDPNSRLTSVDGPWANDTVTYTYNELGQLKDLIPQAGESVTYSYDSIGRRTGVQIGVDTYIYGYTGINPLIQSLTRPNGSASQYLYNDPLKRLTDVINKNSLNDVINSYSYGYNDLDVRSSETVTNGNPITSFTEGITSYNYNNLNQLLSSANPNQTFTYDDDGNMTRGYTPEGHVLIMTYDAENRLKTAEYTDGLGIVHRLEYSYSGDSLLAEVRKFENGGLISDSRFIRAGFLPVQERDGNNAVAREYTWGLNYGGGIGGLLNLKQGGINYSYLYDGKGNVTSLIEPGQNISASYTYDPFGVLVQKIGSLNQPFQFSTKEYDLETGVSYYGYRFYSPAVGRWITRDPLAEGGGISLYGFVFNNPANFRDPLGLEAFIYHGIETLIAGLVTGQGLNSFGMAWDSMVADYGTQSQNASDTIIHGMVGEDSQLKRRLTPQEAIEQAQQRVRDMTKCGKYGDAAHTVQDLNIPFHRGVDYRGSNPLENPDILAHWWMDAQPWGLFVNIPATIQFFQQNISK